MNFSAADASALSCTDWRGWSAHRIAPLLDREARRWADDLHWDQRWTFTRLEEAREDGRLPGAVASNDVGDAKAWTYFLRHLDQFQVGTVVSESVEATNALVSHALASPLAEGASVVVFTPDAPGLTDALTSHGVRTEPYDYLVRDLPISGPQRGLGAIRPLDPVADADAVAALLGEAYRGTTFVRPFVPGGEPDEWSRYVRQLIDTRGCGEFLPAASVLAMDLAAGGAVDGAVLATTLSHDTGHVAQVAVASHARGRGLARELLEASLQACAMSGLTRVTLLVARTNVSARAVYAGLGFQSVGTFLAGLRP